MKHHGGFITSKTPVVLHSDHVVPRRFLRKLVMKEPKHIINIEVHCDHPANMIEEIGRLLSNIEKARPRAM